MHKIDVSQFSSQMTGEFRVNPLNIEKRWWSLSVAEIFEGWKQFVR